MNIESVWDYPRPPRLEAAGARIRVVDGGRVLADSTEALRVLETSHPPVYYIPAAGVDLNRLARSAAGRSFCEFKGVCGLLGAGWWRGCGLELSGAGAGVPRAGGAFSVLRVSGGGVLGE